MAAQVRAGRELVGLSQADLVTAANVGLVEEDGGNGVQLKQAHLPVAVQT